jgi:hypothetical protein
MRELQLRLLYSTSGRILLVDRPRQRALEDVFLRLWNSIKDLRRESEVLGYYVLGVSASQSVSRKVDSSLKLPSSNMSRNSASPDERPWKECG